MRLRLATTFLIALFLAAGAFGRSVGAPEQLGIAFRRAATGDIVSLFATGLGPGQRTLETGEIPGTANPLLGNVAVRVGALTLPHDDIFYAGFAPCCAGLYQIVIRIPSNAESGEIGVILEAGGMISAGGPYLGIE